MKKVAVFLADGFEEVEGLTIVDWLRRAGIGVSTVSIGTGKTVLGDHKIPVIADMTLKELGDAAGYDALATPGGLGGAQNLAACAGVGKLLKAFTQAGKWVCSICASPALVLAPLGLLEGKGYTCYPGFEKGLKTGKHVNDKVVIDGMLITSQGPGTAALFAKTIVEKLLGGAGAAAAKDLAEQTLM
jgi:4-methyl-5(b-hydroxyethyl)-thiazole monophosphate biosynthesis